MSFRACRILMLCVLCCNMTCPFAQTKLIDSLRHVVDTSRNTDQKLNAYYRLSDQALDPDTIYPYTIAAENWSRASKEKNAIALTQRYKATYYARKNYVDSGLMIMDKLISQYKSKKDEQHLYLDFIFFRAKILDRGNRYSNELTQLYEVVETSRNLRDTATLIQSKTGIGWVLMEMQQYKEALKWLNDALRTSSNKKYYENYGALFSNMATAYSAIGNKDSALYYINTAINNARKSENLLFLATALSMQAKIFVDHSMISQAEAPLHEVLAIRKVLNDSFYLVYDMSNLASYYAKNGQPEKGIEICKEGIAIAKKMKLSSQLLMIYEALSENYKAANNQQAYAKTLEDIIVLKDSFNNINSTKILADLQSANETQKREQTISEQKLRLTIKNYWLWGSALFLIMCSLIAWLIFKDYRRRQKLHLKMAVKDASEGERKRIAADLHDNLGAQATAILYSAELLQQNKEQKEVLVNDLHNTAKDMLSSLRETLWVLKKTDVTATDIWIRIISFSKQLGTHYPAININIEGVAPSEVHFSSVTALNIMFIIREAINNALRHSLANKIDVASEYSSGKWKLSVIDDGSGFDIITSANKNESYGLQNMRERAQATLLDLMIDSRTNQGTHIRLIINTDEVIAKQ